MKKTESDSLIGSLLGVATAVSNPRTKSILKRITNHFCRKQHLFNINIYHGSTVCIIVDDSEKEKIDQLIMEYNSQPKSLKP